MNIIENNNNEEYRFTLDHEDRVKLEKAIDKLLEWYCDVPADVVLIAIALHGQGDKAYTDETMWYSHQTFDAINNLFNGVYIEKIKNKCK